MGALPLPMRVVNSAVSKLHNRDTGSRSAERRTDPASVLHSTSRRRREDRSSSGGVEVTYSSLARPGYCTLGVCRCSSLPAVCLLVHCPNVTPSEAGRGATAPRPSLSPAPGPRLPGIPQARRKILCLSNLCTQYARCTHGGTQHSTVPRRATRPVGNRTPRDAVIWSAATQQHRRRRPSSLGPRPPPPWASCSSLVLAAAARGASSGNPIASCTLTLGLPSQSSAAARGLCGPSDGFQQPAIPEYHTPSKLSGRGRPFSKLSEALLFQVVFHPIALPPTLVSLQPRYSFL